MYAVSVIGPVGSTLVSQNSPQKVCWMGITFSTSLFVLSLSAGVLCCDYVSEVECEKEVNWIDVERAYHKAEAMGVEVLHQSGMCG